jgi:hypothetical protein
MCFLWSTENPIDIKTTLFRLLLDEFEVVQLIKKFT